MADGTKYSKKGGWQPKLAAGLWCVGGTGTDNWRLGRTSEEVVPVVDRMHILKSAGMEGYSGHIGADYEFDLDNSRAPNYVESVFNQGERLGLVCVDVVGSEFKTERVRDGSFTSEDPEVRDYAINNATRAARLARMKGINVVRLWFGSDGKNGPFHRSNYDSIQRIEDGLLAVYDAQPEIQLSIEGKPGEPMGFQVIGGTGNAIAMCVRLNEMVGKEKDVTGRFIDPAFVIGPELNHMVMNGEDPEEGVAQAIAYGVMGDIHACDGLFRVARDFDDQVGKYNPAMIFETLARMHEGYEKGIYDSEWIILDQNTSKLPQGRQQIQHLMLSGDFIYAALDKAKSKTWMGRIEELQKDGDYASLDRLVMGLTGRVLVDAANRHPVGGHKV